MTAICHFSVALKSFREVFLHVRNDSDQENIDLDNDDMTICGLVEQTGDIRHSLNGTVKGKPGYYGSSSNN